MQSHGSALHPPTHHRSKPPWLCHPPTHHRSKFKSWSTDAGREGGRRSSCVRRRPRRPGSLCVRKVRRTRRRRPRRSGMAANGLATSGASSTSYSHHTRRRCARRLRVLVNIVVRRSCRRRFVNANPSRARGGGPPSPATTATTTASSKSARLTIHEID